MHSVTRVFHSNTHNCNNFVAEAARMIGASVTSVSPEIVEAVERLRNNRVAVQVAGYWGSV
jgi:hypothetical protein